MKLLLLKILLQRRAKDEGFTLPMVIALGLVMILLGAVNITSANEENLNAITKNSGSDALAIAEIGVARYRQLLDRNRTLALYDHDQWIGRTDICFNNINEATGADDNIPSFVPGTSNSLTLSEDGTDLNNDGDTTDTFPTGSYELVSYEYDNDGTLGDGDDDGIFDLTDDWLNNNARGVLTVKGITPDGNEAQIEVDIPIRINTEDMGNLAPALWIGDDSVTAADLGNLTVGNNGNIVLQDKAVITGTTADGCGDYSALEDGVMRPTVISDPRDIPSIDSIETIVTAAENVTGDDRTNSLPAAGDNRNSIGSVGAKTYGVPSGSAFNAATDCPTIRDCRYYYKSGSTTISNNLTTDGIARATMYIDGTLNITPTSDITIGSDVASNYFEIYVDNGQAIAIDTTGGNVTINGFIHAPGSTLTITGSGTVTINGSVWVNDFVNTTAAVTISPDDSNLSTSTSNKAYEFYTTTNQRTPKPITGSPVNWKTEEAS